MTSDPTSAGPLLELHGITKAFPGVLANDRVDLELRAGEVHALLGENGAGKSTLISILSGMYRPDAGEIRFQGREVEIDSPRAAIELGIGTVYQHLTLVPTLSVLENLMLGSHGGTGRLDLASANDRFAELARLLGVDFASGARAGALALGQQQQVEIMKALWRQGSRVLILDEPTSMLTPQGYEELRRELEHLKDGGLAVVLITHKLHEAIELGDRVTVLRAGRKVGSLAPDDLRGRSESELSARIVEMMFGEQAAELADAVEVEAAPAARESPRRELGAVALRVRDLALDADDGVVGLSGVGLEVRAGEIVGIAGVDGNGQRELAELIAGQRRPRRGEVLLFDEDVTRLGVREREARGLRYVTDDRLGEGTVGDLDVAMNAVLKRIGRAPFWRGGTERREEIDRFAEGLVDRFDVRTPSVQTRIATLSGGNVQKLLLAREFAGEPRAVVFNKPTHGLDVRTAEFVREQIREAAGAGLAALVISTEIEELVDLCDRIAVMSRGEVTGEVENSPGVEERIGALMVARAGAGVPAGSAS
ncbi:MAG: ATP-binding cassette domain-containing protein [Solirubrobacterales bacterium]|nr:ATP-binding cassette domain-containing protein [Solirubrobacterales bacterium]